MRINLLILCLYIPLISGMNLFAPIFNNPSLFKPSPFIKDYAPKLSFIRNKYNSSLENIFDNNPLSFGGAFYTNKSVTTIHYRLQGFFTLINPYWVLNLKPGICDGI